MDNLAFIRSLLAIGGIPLIVALVQGVKPFIADTRFYPLIAIGVGLVINVLGAWAIGGATRLDWVAAGLYGLVAGLSASGLYSGVSSVIKGSTNLSPAPPAPAGKTDGKTG